MNNFIGCEREAATATVLRVPIAITSAVLEPGKNGGVVTAVAGRHSGSGTRPDNALAERSIKDYRRQRR